MKKRIKIALVSLLMLCPMVSNAQLRYGYEVSALMGTDEDVVDLYEGMQVGLTFEYLLPRKWFPNDMAVSVRTGVGATYIDYEYEYEYTSYRTEGSYYNGKYHYTQVPYTSYYWDGDDNTALSIPLEAEFKYLVTNNFRLYANVGATFHAFNSELQDNAFGTQFGAGFEWKWFRLGYKYVNFPEDMFDIDSDGGTKAHAITLSYVFNGSRLLKKKSKLKMY